jgi:hypothetical protein
MSLDLLPLLIAWPKGILARDPDPEKRITSAWNQNCLALAAKLMSFD